MIYKIGIYKRKGWFDLEDILILIFMGVIGLLFMYWGFLLCVKEKINIMHDYHYTKVNEADKKAYTQIMGIAVIVIGVGCLLSGVASLFIGGAKSGIVFGGFFAIGILMMLYGQIKYNHGLF